MRRAVAEHPSWCSALAVASLAIECAGVLWLWPRLRRTAAILAILMHVGIALLLGYLYVSWMILVVAAAWFRLGAGGEGAVAPAVTALPGPTP
jgi:hypothetical protein